MHVSCHKVSLLTLTQVMHNLWREIRKIQLMKCPLNFDCTTRQKHLGNPNLKPDTSWLLPKWNLQSAYVHFWNKKRGTLFLCKNFVAQYIMFSMKRSRTTKCITVSKTCLENQAENTVFLFQISNTENNLWTVNCQ